MNYDNLRHSCAHLLAAAVLDLYPKALPTIGPAIDNGFYYDFDNLKISGEDLPRIETKMHELVKSWSEFKKIEVNDQKAMQQFSHNSYKLELIADLTKNHEPITIYQSGSFTDLCRGGHCEHPSKELKHFRLLSIAGAYWRGNEKNKMLSRIYGTAFSTRKELDEYLTMLEESKKRDHKKLGPALELFMFHETAPGMPYWLPKGVIIYNELVNFWRREHKSRGYQEIVSPILNKKELYITSGHYDHYWSEMFVAKTDDEGEYGVKAMNCPNAHVVFGSKTRSYRDLPLRLSDTDSLHRYERSGVLNGLFRVREFRQDDAHIYVSKDQIKSEYKEVFDIVERFYSVFNLKYSFRLGTRNPENFMGNVATWDKAEATLKKILEDSGKEYSILDGDGAFYGPKVDILMKDSLGREWQMGTVQLDFQQPRRFKLQYTAADGTQKTPVTIHRVIYGSLERFIGILIEHYGGAFPLWLAPVQAVILPISDKHADYAQKVLDSLKLANIRCELVLRNEPLPARVRDAEMQKIPYILVVGNREAEAGLISIRHRGDKENVTKPIAEFISGVTADIIAKV
ncbi:MAG: Threonine-tRNA ligase [Candidatus Amesbacteria bacterium GW2011_GWA1_46_35]|uniref:Threonine--tRNA ligase n=1 Tax=Candidatus Amesbacteria bacterium GW2011_GWC2_45_19 TaxID=1618366 RepID=A0A0G1Q3E0_9BACT|nr:MAG: Threonine-tRNA ligase [Candidatus Amesbacteria bacterium GW2011_GWC2_45_19]KKU38649.1 MAG: Threonine-tRNA ligase [Candidatus Amesbacteria bacterium GW2011_GWA1_46_35]KKU68646.1 MAG: Threonine-tRNA ligase [Microgenomates group bacterium GW2011_GWC1_47_20]